MSDPTLSDIDFKKMNIDMTGVAVIPYLNIPESE